MASERAEEFRLHKAKMRLLLRAAKDRPCADCGQKYPYYVMEFDHVRGLKRFTIGNALMRSFRIVLVEIEKCDVVCANCHKERTHRRTPEYTGVN